MGIIKIRRQGPGEENYVHRFPVNYTEEELVQEDRFIVGEDHDNDDDDDFHHSDTGCEYALVNDQISNIPYELYELKNLKDILCLETWNLYLTEEERFDLAAYLPDMDQETFELTMVELLRGDNLDFGSPLEILFHRLKGGFYSLKVARLREGLKFLQERGYYYSLRSYHESMGEKFVEMRKAWRISLPNTSVEERVQIWKDKNIEKLVFPVDLNAFPFDEVNTHVTSIHSNTMTLNSRRKAKGVLKLKPPQFSAPQQIVSTLPSETWEPIRRPPKGVLKLKPKVHATGLEERPRANAVSYGQGSGTVCDVHASKFSPSGSSSQWQEKNITEKLNYVHQLVGNSCVYGGSPILELDSLNIGSKLFDKTRSSRKTKILKDMRMSSNGSSGFAECLDSQQKGALSSGLYQSARDNSRWELLPVRTNVLEAVPRMIAANDYAMFPASPNHSGHQSRDKDGEDVEKSCRFPITYKRKKPHTKLNALHNQIKPSTAPAVQGGTNFFQVEKTKAIRIRVKGWNEFGTVQAWGP